MQFNDEFVQQHHPKFKTAEELRKSLLAATCMQRVKVLDEQLGEAVQKVAWGHTVGRPDLSTRLWHCTWHAGGGAGTGAHGAARGPGA